VLHRGVAGGLPIRFVVERDERRPAPHVDRVDRERTSRRGDPDGLVAEAVDRTTRRAGPIEARRDLAKERALARPEGDTGERLRVVGREQRAWIDRRYGRRRRVRIGWRRRGAAARGRRLAGRA